MLRQTLALLVVCFVTAVWAADPLAISGVTIAAPANPLAAAKYGKVELVVALTGGTFTRVYDPRPSAGGLDLRATFAGPDASQWNVCGYYDGASWRVRFTPTVTGNWTFSVSAQDSSRTATWSGGSFTCVASAAPGFARIDGKNLRCSEGTVLYAIGANNGWQYDVEQPAFATLAAQGINLMSFWMNSPWITPNDTQPRAPIENVTQGIGVYNQPACAYLDSVVADAEAAGIYLLPTIWSHGNLRKTGTHNWGTGWWDNLAYTSICTPTNFFKTTSGSSDTAQWAYQKNFYRYVLARWGYSRAVVAWVSLCEIEGTTGYAGTGGSANAAQATAWCGAIRDYFAANDPYRVLAGKYPAAVSKTDWSSDATTWSNYCNLAAVDSYTQQTNNVEVANAIASQTTSMRGTGRPAFHSEFGGQMGSGASEPAHMHNGVWAGSAAGACLSPLKWCDGGSWPLLTDPVVGTALCNQLSFLSQFMASLGYVGASGYTAATVTVSPTTSRGWGMRLGDRGFAWVQNKTGTMGGQTVAVSTLAAGRYQVTWYDAWSSAAGQTLPSGLVVVGGNGVLNLTVPTLAQNDIAVKFVLWPNSAPVASNQNVTLAENAAQPITLVATDADNDVLTYSIVSQPAHASLTGTPPNVTYTAAAGYYGADSFTFKANDGLVDSNIATVSITITRVNSAPVASNQDVTLAENTAQPITLVATDADNDVLTYSTLSEPAHGSLTGTPPNVTYTPAVEYNGADSFTFKANDGLVDSNIATVSITITAVNDPPVIASPASATPNPAAVGENVSFSVGASDPEGQPVTCTWDFGDATGGSGASTTHTYTVAGTYAATVTVSDGELSTPSSVVVQVLLPNSAPVASDQDVALAENTAQPITLVATDADNDVLSYSIVSPPANGNLTGTPPNVTYTPAVEYNGADSFTFKANDGRVDSNIATVSITITAVNDPPVIALPASATPNPAAVGESVSFSVSAFDPEGQPVTCTWDFGDATGGSGASTTHTYTTAGTYTATVTVSDGQLSTPSSVVVQVKTAVTVSFQDGAAPTGLYAGTTDASIKSASATKNFGTANPLEVNGNSATFALMKWDLAPAAIPAASRVLSAQFTVNVTDGTGNAFTIYELKRAWVESQATWRTARPSVNWQTAGAQGATDRGSTALGTATGGTGSRTFALNTSGVALVQNWIGATSSNNGLTIQGPSSMTDILKFSSHEATPASSRPKLTIRYVAP